MPPKAKSPSVSINRIWEATAVPQWLQEAEKIVVNDGVFGCTMNDMIHDLLKGPFICGDAETTGTNIVDDQIVSLQFCSSGNRAWFVPIAMVGMDNLSMSYVAHKLAPVWKCGLVFHGGAFDWQFIQRYADFEITADTMVEAKCLPDLWIMPRDFSLKGLAGYLFKLEVIKFNSLFPRRTADPSKRFDLVDRAVAIPYACQDPLLTYRLHEYFLSRLDTNHFIYRLEHEIIKPVARMELLGIGFNSSLLDQTRTAAEVELAELTSLIYEQAGSEFNIGSPAQLGTILYDTLGLTCSSKTPGGQRSVGVEALDSLEGQHPIIGYLGDYRDIVKLKTAFLDKLPTHVASDGNIHCSIHPWGAISGRTSSSGPNLQQVPKPKGKGAHGDDIRKLIRQAFIPPAGFVGLLDQDYSQLEYRLFGSLSQDPTLVEAFLAGEDVHKRTASIVFGVPYDKVDSTQRDRGKTLNFASIYGQGPDALAKAFNIPVYKSKEFIRDYWARMPGAAKYVRSMETFAKNNLYCETYFGRRRSLPYANSKNMRLRSESEREAVNSPIQGLGSDLMKIAIIRGDKALAQGFKSRMCLTVHDQLVTAIHPDDKLYEVAEVLRDAMEIQLDGFVPLLTEAKYGPNWYDTTKHTYTKSAVSVAVIWDAPSSSVPASVAVDPPVEEHTDGLLDSEPLLGSGVFHLNLEPQEKCSEDEERPRIDGHNTFSSAEQDSGVSIQPQPQAAMARDNDITWTDNATHTEVTHWLTIEGHGPPLDAAMAVLLSAPGLVAVYVPFESTVKDTGIRATVTPETLFRLRRCLVAFTMSKALRTDIRGQVGGVS